jgi:hypothetical protein
MRPVLNVCLQIPAYKIVCCILVLALSCHIIELQSGGGAFPLPPLSCSTQLPASKQVQRSSSTNEMQISAFMIGTEKNKERRIIPVQACALHDISFLLLVQVVDGFDK